MSRAPLFGSTELAAAIEAAECRLLRGALAPARARGATPEPFEIDCAGGVALWAEADSPLNKVAGLGFGGMPAETELAAIEHAYAVRRSPVQVELANLGQPEIATLLTARGYRLVGFENVLALRLDGATFPETPGEIEIRESAADDGGAWLDVVVGGFAYPDTQGVASHEEFPRDVLERVIGDLTSGGGFLRFVALRDGATAGGGSLRIDRSIAQLTGAATLPAHRRRGVQTTLLHARLRAAAEAGCELAVVTTQPGSKSQQNVQRQGFELIYTRAVLVLEP